MPSKYWFKLYHEILDDPKMGQLSDRLYRRCIELFALAGDYDQDGLLPEIEDIAWRLRLSIDELQKDIADLQALSIITSNDDGLVVTNFSKRQEPVSGAERVASFRERKRKEQYYGNEDETYRYTDTDIDVDKEEDIPRLNLQKEIDRFLEMWKFYFPDKPQPRKPYKKVKAKLSARLKDDYFVLNYEKALEKASTSEFVKGGGWFDAPWFLHNEENWEKCLNDKYKNNGTSRRKSQAEQNKEASEQAIHDMKDYLMEE